MPRYLARTSCEYTTLIAMAKSEKEAMRVAKSRAMKNWDEAWSDIEIEPEIGDKTEEKTEVDSSDLPEVICLECGSDNVEYTVWYNPNTDETGDMFGSWNFGDNSYCNDCEENRPLLSRGEDEKKFDELREKYMTYEVP